MNKLFCFGYGYTCDYLWHYLEKIGGWKISGTTRDPSKRAEMRSNGIGGFLFDYSSPLSDPLFILKDVTHLLISTPPLDEGDPSFLIHAEDIIRISSIKWVGYLSTTAVYGDRDGDLVDEKSQRKPTNRRGTKRMIAEDQWLSLLNDYNLPVHIFRLSGIYGPGRSALDSVRAGMARRIEKPGHAFSRIHVEDIVQTLIASMLSPNPGSIYNLADDLPAPSHEVIAYACGMLDLPCPPLISFEDAELAPITRSFYSDNKRVSNEKIKKELGIKLKYPDYKSGLRGCLEAEKHAIDILKSG